MSHDALFQLGMGSVSLNAAQAEDQTTAGASDVSIGDPEVDPPQEPADHFIEKDGVTCAGAHLIIDLFGADCCYPVDSAAPAHVWDRDPAGWWCLVGCDGMLWRSQPQLLRQAVFLAEALPAMRRAGLDIRLRGQGHLAAAMLRTGGRWFDALAATDMLETGELLEPAER